MKTFKNYLKTLKNYPYETNKTSNILNEMAKWEEVLVLDGGNKGILDSKINDSYKKLEDFIFLKIINSHFLFCYVEYDKVVAYVDCTKTEFNINKRTTLTIQLSRVSDKHRGKGLGRKLYYYILEHFALMSDISNTPDSCKVWMAIFETKKFNTGIINTKTKVLYPLKDLKLKDTRVWRDFILKDDDMINPITKESLIGIDREIGLFHRVYAFKD